MSVGGVVAPGDGTWLGGGVAVSLGGGEEGARLGVEDGGGTIVGGGVGDEVGHGVTGAKLGGGGGIGQAPMASPCRRCARNDSTEMLIVS